MFVVCNLFFVFCCFKGGHHDRKIFSLAILTALFVLIIELIRRERLTFQYAIGWICAVIGGALIVLAEGLAVRMANALGFELLSNFVFFCCMGIAVILGLFLTVLLCRQAKHNERMAKKIAWLEDEVKDLKNDK